MFVFELVKGYRNHAGLSSRGVYVLDGLSCWCDVRCILIYTIIYYIILLYYTYIIILLLLYLILYSSFYSFPIYLLPSSFFLISSPSSSILPSPSIPFLPSLTFLLSLFFLILLSSSIFPIFIPFPSLSYILLFSSPNLLFYLLSFPSLLPIPSISYLLFLLIPILPSPLLIQSIRVGSYACLLISKSPINNSTPHVLSEWMVEV